MSSGDISHGRVNVPLCIMISTSSSLAKDQLPGHLEVHNLVFISGRHTRAVGWFPRKRAVAELPDFNRESGILDRDPGIAFEHLYKQCGRNSFRLCNLSLFYQVLELSSGFRC